VYLASVIFPRLGIAEEMRVKARMIPADPVAAVVARGDAEIGIQTLSAMVPVPGVDIVGILPEALQKATVFAAGIAAGAKEPEAGRALIRFLTSSPAAEVIEKTGMQPLGDPPLDPDVRAGGLLYLNSIGLPKEARVCALRIAGYLDEFNPAYEKWKLRHEALIRLGRETFEREAPKHGLSAEKMAGELTDDAARGLARATPAIQLEACKSRLSALEQTVEPKRPLR
jgi:hypothetical protein